ncbi:sodium/glutamate symporter [Fusobacterium perfoetens]|uniref:sodium/glutamate symporter n=1 Tax=Fusobacterium perfoetens TaxID=852 RepID=UPI000687070E|nr:sodium/glutamate symporter [Fusobacterium perfoetens]
MQFTAWSMLLDFCIMSGLLFIAQMMRSKIKFLQNYYIPSSLVAGFLGLFGGPQFLDILPFSNQTGSYAYLLVCVLFAGIFLGKQEKFNLKETVNKVGDTFLINMSSEFMCFGLACLLGGILVKIFFPNVFVEISVLLPSGFMGGHGYAAAIGGTLNTLLNRTDGVVIGQTFATIGLLVGIFGGIICINYATRKRATKLIESIGSLPEECKTGMIPVEKRQTMGDETVHPMAMDPLAWHIGLILMTTGIGFAIYSFYKQYFPNIEVPLMCVAMLVGVVIQGILNKIGYGSYVDKRVIDRIGSGVTDYLVAFGVATIQVSVVLDFIGPILVLCIIGTAWPVILVFYVARKLFRNFWFERSIFIFGYITGVVAVGVTLLRIVDPEMKSGTLDDFGTAYTLQSIIELFLITMVPVFCVSIGVIPIGAVLTTIALGMLLLCKIKYGSYSLPMDALRPGEAEIIGRK